MPGKGTAIAAGTAGIILVWSGVQNRTVLDTVRSIIAGKKPSPGPGGQAVSVTGNAQSGAGNPQAGSQLASNQALGKLMAGGYGWSSGPEWTALNNIVMAESGWDANAKNPSSDASGIAQNINGFSASYPAGNASAQIQWMLSYIKNRYGDPVTAWNFHLANGWY